MTSLQQISLKRLKEFDIKPKRDLGQNFLIDDNILQVILGQLDCQAEDVVLEVGAGLGVLTQALVRKAAQVHAFEVDRSFEGPLVATLGGSIVNDLNRGGDLTPANISSATSSAGVPLLVSESNTTNSTVHISEDEHSLNRRTTSVRIYFQDILKANLESLDPPPTLCASNLPYSVAGPFLIEALQRLPGVRRYCVMVQKEVADRIAAAPGSKTYGTLSVWVQLYAKVSQVRPLSRSIFYPQPHVDSSLLLIDRKTDPDLPQVELGVLQTVIANAFAQRRKTLLNALSSGGVANKEQVATWLSGLDLPLDVRAERLSHEQFVRLAQLLAQSW